MNHFKYFYLIRGIILGSFFALWQNFFLLKGYDQAFISGIVSGFTLLSILVEIPSGYLSDRLGHKALTSIGVLIFVLAFSLSTFFPSTPSFIISVLLIGPAEACINGALQGWISESQTQIGQALTTHSFMSRDQYRTVGMIAGAFGIPYLIHFSENIGITFWITSFALSIPLLMVTIATPNPKKTIKDSHGLLDESPSSILKLVFAPELRLFWLATCFFGIADGVTSIGLWARLHELGLKDTSWFGIIQASMSVTRLLSVSIWKKFSNVEDKTLTGKSLIYTAIPFALFGFAPTLLVAIPVWLLRVSFACIYFSAIDPLTLSLPLAKKNSATIFSIAGFVAGITSLIFTASVAISPALLSTGQIAYIGALASLISGLFFFRIGKNLKANF